MLLILLDLFLILIYYIIYKENLMFNEFKEFKEFIDRQKWTFAITYAQKAPHEYIVKGKLNGTDEEFDDAVKYIYDNGIPMSYFGWENKYFYMDGRLYWALDPAESPIIINREDVNEYIYSIRWRGPKKGK